MPKVKGGARIAEFLVDEEFPQFLDS